MVERGKSVLLAGATGLVGGALLERLFADAAFAKITVIARRPLTHVRHRKLSVHMLDFDKLDQHADLFHVDQIFWALGTTIKQAGSREGFRAVDFGYAEKAAHLGAQAGAKHFLLVSALGADIDSGVFYNRVKGETEQIVMALPYRSVTIVRPSFLLGPREEFRPGELIARQFARFAPAKYRAVEASDVAMALVSAAKIDAPGHTIIESRDIPRVGWK